MLLWKILIIVNLVCWYLPVISFRNNKKYLLFFVVNSLVDPIYIALRYTFNIGTYNYIPIALFFEAMTLPLIDSKSRTVTSVALLLIAFSVGMNSYLEFIVCELVISLMIYSILKDAFSAVKEESALKVFQILLLIYFLRNLLMFYLYYSNQEVLTEYYTLFLIMIIILPILIAYYGPEKNISISKKIAKSLSPYIPEVQREVSVLEITNKKNGHGLTEREYEIIKLVSGGNTNKQIAEKLFLSKSSIDHARVQINEKLGICKRSDYLEFLEKYSSRFPAKSIKK